MGMFDWDRDFDDVLSETRVAEHARPDPAQADPLDGADAQIPTLRDLLAPGQAMLLALGLGVAALLPEQLADASKAAPLLDSAALAGVLASAQPVVTLVPPPELEVYDAAQYRAFLTGLRDFGDAQLRDYAALMARDLGQSAGFLKPSFRDALRVAQYEMTRRGLELPSELAHQAPPLDNFAGGGGACTADVLSLAPLPAAPDFAGGAASC